MTMKIPEGITQLECTGIAVPKLERGPLSYVKPGSFVSIRPANDDRTYLGIYIGDMPVGVAGIQKKGEDGVVHLVRTQPNPCIFIPQLEQLFYGLESWWGEIKEPDDLHQISDADIENVWYVRALKGLVEKESIN
jgi:hypothetical protein